MRALASEIKSRVKKGVEVLAKAAAEKYDREHPPPDLFRLVSIRGAPVPEAPVRDTSANHNISVLDAAARNISEPEITPRGDPELETAPRGGPLPEITPCGDPELETAPRSVSEPETMSRGVSEPETTSRGVPEPEITTLDRRPRPAPLT